MDRLNMPEARVVQQMQQPCCKQNTLEKKQRASTWETITPQVLHK